MDVDGGTGAFVGVGGGDEGVEGRVGDDVGGGEGVAVAGDEGGHTEAAVIGEAVLAEGHLAGLDDLHGTGEAEVLGGDGVVPGVAVGGVGGEFFRRRGAVEAVAGEGREGEEGGEDQVRAEGEGGDALHGGISCQLSVIRYQGRGEGHARG